MRTLTAEDYDPEQWVDVEYEEVEIPQGIDNETGELKHFPEDGLFFSKIEALEKMIKDVDKKIRQLEKQRLGLNEVRVQSYAELGREVPYWND